MKKIFISASALFFLIPALSMATTTESTMQSENATYSEAASQSSQVVFRSTQRLRSNDGRSIYLYTNRTCELYDGDRLEVSCTYTIMGNEIRLLDENGYTVYKASFTYTSDHRNISSITLGGTRYFRF